MAARTGGQSQGTAEASAEAFASTVEDVIDRAKSPPRKAAAMAEENLEPDDFVSGDFKSAALEHGRHLYEAAVDQATGFADRRKDEVAQSVADVATSLRETGRQFEDRPNVRAFMGSAADGLDQLAGGLKERSVADLYGEVEAYARRSPVTVGAVALAAGFLLARFVKASSDSLSETAATRETARRESLRRRTKSA